MQKENQGEGLLGLKTAECVTPKHPDKLCDQISDAILDVCLVGDKNSRVAVEVMGGHGAITITGEITTNAEFDPVEIARRVAGSEYEVGVNIVQQSNEIAQGVDTGGAGDQGIMVGYACNDNEAHIPQELYLARSLAQHLYKKYPYDGKTQVTLDAKNRVHAVVASFQNSKQEELLKEIKSWISEKKVSVAEDVVLHANAGGDWFAGGFEADTGLTGRKLAVDNYGPQVPLGGGCFSGKDATKVDRSAAYMARRIAVDIIKERNANEVVVKLAYALGVAKPVMATAFIDGIEEGVDTSAYDLTPKGIKKALQLETPVYEQTARWGHFGSGFIWG